MILGIICVIVFIISLIFFAYYSDEYSYFGMIISVMLGFVSGLGIITFICINAEKIVRWFEM